MELDEWLNNNQLAIDIFNKKYRYNNETLDQWFERTSGGDEKVEDLLKYKRFLFGGRVLANRGLDLKGRKITLNNCYVLPAPEDHIESIYDTAKMMARTFSWGGGVGIDLGKLSPYGAKINNAAKTTSGAISFGDLYDTTTALIGSEGRRAALMLSMPCTHPDIEQFITVKSDLNKLNKANLSIRVTDEFMQAVVDNTNFKLLFTRETGEVISKTVKANQIFDKFVLNNYNYGEPGLLFWDEIERWNMICTNDNYKLSGINPCGEKPLSEFGACALGSFNLDAYIRLNSNYEWEFNFKQFIGDIPTVVKAMNDILDEGLNLHPLPEQRVTVAKYREIGIGVFGFANVLMHLKIKYGSPESISLAEKIASTLLNECVIASAKLANEYGTYPAYNSNAVCTSEFFEVLTPEAQKFITMYGLRNATLLSIAPTGTLSTLCQKSGGIEPLFATSYTRKTESLHKESVAYKVYDPTVDEIMNDLGIYDVKNLPDYIITSSQIDPHARVLMQAAWQKYIDSSISSTVNLPQTATVEDIKNVYIDAWKNNLKGITVYRSGCAREGILSTETNVQHSNSNVQACNSNTLKRGDWKQLAEDTVYYERRVYTGCASFALFIGWSNKEQKLQDVWVKQKGKGGCSRSIDAMVIELSAILRFGGSLSNIEKAFTGLETCNSFIRAKDKGQKLTSGSSCADCILKTVKDFEKHMTSTRETKMIEAIEQIKTFCPECGEELAHEGGCITCKACGYSKCS